MRDPNNLIFGLLERRSKSSHSGSFMFASPDFSFQVISNWRGKCERGRGDRWEWWGRTDGEPSPPSSPTPHLLSCLPLLAGVHFHFSQKRFVFQPFNTDFGPIGPSFTQRLKSLKISPFPAIFGAVVLFNPPFHPFVMRISKNPFLVLTCMSRHGYWQILMTIASAV